MVNKKEILIFTILCTLNFLFYRNPILGSILAVTEIGFIFYYLVITRSLKRTFYWHMLFMLSSLETFLDETAYDINTIIYSYKHFEIPFIPIALSTLITVFLFIFSLFTKNKVIYAKHDYTYRFILVSTILSISTGIIGVLGRGYELSNFINAAMIPVISLCTYGLLIDQTENKEIEKFKSLLTSALIGSVLSSYIGAVLGVQASYGASFTFPGNQIIMLSPFLINISIYLFGKQKRFVFIVGLLACVELVVFNASGKGIIFVLLALIIYFYKMATNKKRFLRFLLMFIVLIIVAINVLNYAFENSNLFRSKFFQVTSLLDFKNWSEGFESIPASPRIRIIETVDIFLSLKENTIDLIIGRGAGGYFEDKKDLFYNIDLSRGAYSTKEIESGRFVSPHESWNEVLLLTGFLGIYMWLRVLLKLFRGIFKDNINAIYKLLGFVFVVVMWNSYVVLTHFGLICLYVSKEKLQKVIKKH